MADDKKDTAHDAQTRDVDEFSGIETTGHEWDGIKELDNPMPRWWLWTFYATIVWGVIYMILYPAIPLISDATGGVLGWSSRNDLIVALAEAEEGRADRIAAINEATVDEILADESLRTFAVAAGQAHFKVNCVQCHGSGAAGGAGYPNLNDDDWIWGGTGEQLYLTLAHGIRYEQDDDTLISDMPRFGADEILSREEIAQVSHFVMSLSGQEHDAAAAEPGAVLYEEQCSSCHGEQGEGIQDLGGPRLNDPIWLYGGSYEEVVAQITNPQMGVMPGWQARLGDRAVKELAVYVHSLGGGE